MTSTLNENIKDIVKNTNFQHVAIIMDGNRRWAKKRLLPSAAGHKKGVEALRSTLKACAKFGIKYLTVYAFSTENWNRDKEEVEFLMSLLAKTIVNEVPEFIENDIKLTFIGDRKTLSKDIIEVLEFGEKETAHCKTLNLQIAFNYGARMEITNAFKALAEKVKNGKLELNEINEDLISQNLYTSNIPDPDLLIRTGGEQRISNYLLWQCAYSEIYITDIFWPEFDENALADAVLEFNSRQRRFGK
ncbi:MAG: isoprenyl transferase [Candidatus Gastranaerophilales bacterium]|nr:isoprenyl transferase [Candidatus Gastranaerophilales bacterium]